MARAVMDGCSLGRDEIVYLLKVDGAQRYELFHYADRIRRHYLGEDISLCSIASVRTGECSEDCRFCAQSLHYNNSVEVGELGTDEIVAAAHVAARNGAHCFGIVASGRGATDKLIDKLAPAISVIAGWGTVECCAALGCLTAEQAEELGKLGVKRYNHNIETCEAFFPKIVTTHNYADRIATVRAARQGGLDVCCGGIVGLGESIENRSELALALRELDIDSIPLNFLNPIGSTPLGNQGSMAPMTALQTIAAFRFALPDRQIKVAGGRETCLRDLQSWMFYAGASSTMIGNYLTTKGRSVQDDLQMLTDLELYNMATG